MLPEHFDQLVAGYGTDEPVEFATVGDNDVRGNLRHLESFDNIPVTIKVNAMDRVAHRFDLLDGPFHRLAGSTPSRSELEHFDIATSGRQSCRQES